MCDLERVLEPLACWCVEEREADLEVILIFRPQAAKYLRDARVMTLYEGTSQIQKLLIG